VVIGVSNKQVLSPFPLVLEETNERLDSDIGDVQIRRQRLRKLASFLLQLSGLISH
jgi:hypothetical protein